MPKSYKKYYISDLHFRETFETGIIREEDLQKIQAINDKVFYHDRLYILGDLTSSSSNPLKLLVKLLPLIVCKTIYLVQGNHDEPRVLDALVTMKLTKNWAPAFKVVKDEAFGVEFELALSHYPVSNAFMQPEPVAILHGHTHGENSLTYPWQFDVSYDAQKMPMTFEELLSKYFGHYANPLTGYIDYKNEFIRQYMKFQKEMQGLR